MTHKQGKTYYKSFISAVMLPVNDILTGYQCFNKTQKMCYKGCLILNLVKGIPRFTFLYVASSY